METKDVQELFSYIKQLHPHCPPDKIPRLTNAVANLWINSLSGYSMEQLFKAADEHARSCRFWPSLAEIVAKLPPRPEEKGRRSDPGPAAQASMERMKEWQKAWHEELRRRGLPTFREAIARGMEICEWRRLLLEAGVWE